MFKHKEKKTIENPMRKTKFSSSPFLCVCLLVVFMVTSVPKKAHACEVGAQMTTMQSIVATLQDAAYAALQAVLQSYIDSVMGPFSDVLTISVETAGTENRDQLLDMWNAWKANLEDMTEQLCVSQVDRSRQDGSMLDSQMQNMTARSIEKKELEAFRKLTPSDQMCVVDSVNPHLLKAEEASRAIVAAGENEFYAGGDITVNSVLIKGTGVGAMNMIGTASENGPDAALNADYNTIISNYFDPNYNGGEMPAGIPSPRAGNQYNPGKTIFGKDTIDLTDENNRLDIRVFTNLAVGGKVLKPVPEQSTKTVAGQHTILERRQYQARLNNYAGALMDPVSRRASVVASPEVYSMRMANGVLAANNATEPSYRETRKARARQAWTPRYMKDLGEGVHTAEQKQVDMYAQKIMDLQDMTRNMERIGMIFSSRLGQRLDGLSLDDGGKFDTRSRQ